MEESKIFKDVFNREIKKCKEHLEILGAHSATLKYTFLDQEDGELMNDLSFTIRSKKDDE